MSEVERCCWLDDVVLTQRQLVNLVRKEMRGLIGAIIMSRGNESNGPIPRTPAREAVPSKCFTGGVPVPVESRDEVDP